MISVVVMVGDVPAQGDLTRNNPAAWVQSAQRTAAADLITQLSHQPLVDRIILVSPTAEELAVAGASDYVPSDPETPHIGRLLALLIEQFALTKVLYFGGGSAPLLSDELLNTVLERLAEAGELVITNNQFAADWAGITPANHVQRWQDRLPRDNMLGWVLSTEGGLPVHAFPASAASRLDIDTPTDLLALSLHAHTKSRLRAFLEALPLDTGRLEGVLQTLARPAGRVFVAGRVGPDSWSALNRVSQCWLRVISEERGMVSSGRQQRGEARSLLAEYIAVAGLDAFFAMLADWADAALIDTRVLLAHHSRWPSRESRFASDVGLPAQIEDDWLQALTAAALACPIPIILGGHGLMSGDLLAFCEILAARQADPGEW